MALLGSTTNVRSTEEQRKFLKGMGSSEPDRGCVKTPVMICGAGADGLLASAGHLIVRRAAAAYPV
jgi:hypothetical protein